VVEFISGNLVQIIASRCKGNGRINSRSPIVGWRPGVPIPVDERYYMARLAKIPVESGHTWYSVEPLDTVRISCSEIGIYISVHDTCPNLDAWPDYYDVTKRNGGQPHIVHKVLFPDRGFLYIENNFLKKVK